MVWLDARRNLTIGTTSLNAVHITVNISPKIWTVKPCNRTQKVHWNLSARNNREFHYTCILPTLPKVNNKKFTMANQHRSPLLALLLEQYITMDTAAEPHGGRQWPLLSAHIYMYMQLKGWLVITWLLNMRTVNCPSYLAMHCFTLFLPCSIHRQK